jgi:hypothetical protein
LINQVWARIPDWVQGLTTTSEEQPIPLIFEPPDVTDMEFYDLTADSDDEQESGGAGGESGADGVRELSWSRRAAEQWMKTHDTSDKNKSERLEQLTKIFERSTRRQNLFDKRCEEAAATEARAQAEQEQREQEEEEAANKTYEVEAICGKRVDDGVTFYRVQWRGFAAKHNTWEPVSNLIGSEMLIMAFEEKFKSCKRPRVNADDYTQTGRKRKKR